ISSSSTISRTENRPIRLVALPALALLAALAATGPARCSWSPGGGPARGKVSCSALTTGRRPATSVASLLTLTWIWTALRPGETATARTGGTGASRRATLASRATAARPAGVRGPPPSGSRSLLEKAVPHQAEPRRPAGHGAVVGDQHHGQAAAAPQVLEQGDDLVPGALVQVAGRLVGEQHPGLLDQRAGDRHP